MSIASPAMLYSVFALGAVAVYLAMPGGRRSARVAAVVFALAAVAGLGAAAVGRWLPGEGSAWGFALLAGIAVFAAGKVVTHAKPVYSAVYFILVVTAVACLMVLQEAEFLGIALIIVYAGAILVTYVFVIMLAQQSGASATDLRAREPFTAVLVGFVTAALIAGQMGGLPTEASRGVYPRAPRDVNAVSAPGSAGINPAARTGESTSPAMAASNTASVGAELLSRYVVALEISGLLLLVAMIGAIVMAKKRVPLDVAVAAAPVPGEIGRTVAPF